MNLMINMNLVIERELELERQGVPRTRRYLGDDPRVIDPRWYQRKATLVTETRDDPVGGAQVPAFKTSRKAIPAVLARLFRLPRTRPEKGCQEYCAPKALGS